MATLSLGQWSCKGDGTMHTSCMVLGVDIATKCHEAARSTL